MKINATHSPMRMAFISFFGLCALFTQSADAQCLQPGTRNAVKDPLPNGYHCIRGYVAPVGQDICLRGPLTNSFHPKSEHGVATFGGTDKFAKPYNPKVHKCIPGGLLLNLKTDWCQTDPKSGKGHVIYAGQPCLGKIIAPVLPQK